MKNFIAFVDRLNRWIFNFLALLFGAIALLTLYQVFARYILKSPLVWSEEAVRYLMIWIVLLGTAIALRKGLLISVEIVLHIVPKRVKKIMEFFVISLNIVLLIFLALYGFDIMENLGDQKTGAMELPVSWLYAAIPVGACLALLNCVVVFIELITKREREDNGGNIIL
jgi:TRAP-type C4-dicarboxylate transport system permease small subunit